MADNDDGLQVRGQHEQDDAPEPWRERLLRWGRDLAITVVGFAALWIGLGALRAPELPSTAPALVGTTLSGETADLAAYAGRTVVLNFWATWCTPCAVEMPWLVRFSRNHPDIPLLFVAVDGRPEQLRAYAEAHDLPAAQVVLPTPAFKQVWPVATLPTPVVVDGEGRIVAAHAGVVLPPQLWWWTY